MDSFPTVITHNFDPARGAFRNICTLPETDVERVLDEIRASGTRRIKANYQRRRRATEDWLMAERHRKLGNPWLARPIYFFLGDFADGLDPSRPRSLIVPLSTLPAETMTFTYPDSMASLSLATKDTHLADRRPYHGKVFTLREITAAVAEFGLPDKHRDDMRSRLYDRFIECQIWDDRPVKRFLESVRTAQVRRSR